MENFDEQGMITTEPEVISSEENNQMTERGNKGNTFAATVGGAAIGTALTMLVVGAFKFVKNGIARLKLARELKKSKKADEEEESKGE